MEAEHHAEEVQSSKESKEYFRLESLYQKTDHSPEPGKIATVERAGVADKPARTDDLAKERYPKMR